MLEGAGFCLNRACFGEAVPERQFGVEFLLFPRRSSLLVNHYHAIVPSVRAVGLPFLSRRRIWNLQ